MIAEGLSESHCLTVTEASPLMRWNFFLCDTGRRPRECRAVFQAPFRIRRWSRNRPSREPAVLRVDRCEALKRVEAVDQPADIVGFVDAPEIDQLRQRSAPLDAELADHAGLLEDLPIELVPIEQSRECLPFQRHRQMIVRFAGKTIEALAGQGLQLFAKLGFGRAAIGQFFVQGRAPLHSVPANRLAGMF